MATPEVSGQHRSATTVIVLALVAAVGLLLGLFGSTFGPFYPLAFGAIVAVVGVVVMAGGAQWGRVLLTLGVAIILGAAVYIAIGVLTPDGTGSGSGTGCVPGRACERP